MVDLSSAVGRYDIGAVPPDLVQALRDLVAPDEQPGPKENVARNCNLTFCWDFADGIAPGEESPPLVLDFPCRINGWTIASKRSETGSASFTVYAGLYADYPAPVSIVAAAHPSVSGGSKAEGSTADVSTWDKTLPRRAVLVAVPDTISGFTKITLSLSAKRLDI